MSNSSFHSRVLITGTDGFLGSRMARHFRERGWNVRSVGRDGPPLQLDGLRPVLESFSPALVIHAAGPSSVPSSVKDPLNDFRRGTAATMELLESLRLTVPQARVLFLSSAAVYGNPLASPVPETASPAPVSPYGFHKLATELLLREYRELHNLQSSSLRIFSAYGEGMKKQVLWDVCRKACEGRMILQGDGSQSRDFLHVNDILTAVEVLATSQASLPSVINLAHGTEVRIAQIAEWIADELQLESAPVFDGVVPVGTPSRWLADVSLLRSFGWLPATEPEVGVRSYARWARQELAQ